jgi:Glycerol kinase
MAGLKIGVYKSLSDISKNWKIDQKFIPKISKRSRTNLLKGWEQAIRKTLI